MNALKTVLIESLNKYLINKKKTLHMEKIKLLEPKLSSQLEDMPKVSIIVPIYNVEKYIEKCINSIATQDYQNIEIIAVDDGSPDHSGAVVDELAKQDDRIKVIHKQNGGVSSARNVGIDNAIGKYIMFVDGDDWVEPDYVSYFLNMITSHAALIGMNVRNYGDNKLKGTLPDNFEITAEKAIEWIYDDHIFVAVWNKIYSRELLKKIRFSNDIWYGEGMLFNIDCLQHVSKVAIGSKSVYHQTFNPDSAMRSFRLASNYCGIASLWLQKAHWQKWTPEIEEQWNYHKYRFNISIISGLVRSGKIRKYKNIYKCCVHNIKKDFFMALKSEKKLRRKISLTGYFISPMLMAKHSILKFNDNLKKQSGGVIEDWNKIILQENIESLSFLTINSQLATGGTVV